MIKKKIIMKKLILTLIFFLSLEKGLSAMQLENPKQIIPNSLYQHYKGMRYKILMVVWNSEANELEEWVVYQGLYEDPKLGKNPIFTRSLTKFLETIEFDGKLEPRFKLIQTSD
jgi:hypothetical protein